MSYQHEKYDHHGYTIRIEHDEGASNPMTEYCAMPTILHWHRRYLLGDKYPESWGNPFDDMEATVQRVKDEYGARVVLPLYLYDHGSISVSTGSFVGRAPHADWDSGVVGLVFDTPKMMKEGWGENHEHPSDEKLAEILKGSVETFDQYLRGDIYGYIVEAPEGYERVGMDSCWGFYGLDECKSEAENVVAWEIENNARQEALINRCMAL